MLMKNSNDTIGNRARDLPACSAVPQPTAPPRAPTYEDRIQNKRTSVKDYCHRVTTRLQLVILIVVITVHGKRGGLIVPVFK